MVTEPIRHSVFRATSRHRRNIALGMAVALVLFFLYNIANGPTQYTLVETVTTILHPDQVPDSMESIIWNDRLPQAITALLVGAALGVAGAEMQTVLDNPLAEPYTLGISMSAAFGASLVMAFGVGIGLFESYATVILAFVFSMVACGAIFLISRRRRSDRVTIILAGVALLFLFQALVSLVQSMASRDAANAITFWMFGSLNRTEWMDLGIMAVVLLAVCLFFAGNLWRLTALRMGDFKAQSLGVNVSKLRRETLIGVSVLTATVVSFTGTIGFIGLVGPHIARMLVGEDQRFFLPVSALSGALFLSGALLVCKTSDYLGMVPIGVMTSMVGVPFFIYMILRGRRTIS